jgi:hypothetical protein
MFRYLLYPTSWYGVFIREARNIKTRNTDVLLISYVLLSFSFEIIPNIDYGSDELPTNFLTRKNSAHIMDSYLLQTDVFIKETAHKNCYRKQLIYTLHFLYSQEKNIAYSNMDVT